MRVLITGGTGFIAKELIKTLNKRNGCSIGVAYRRLNNEVHDEMTVVGEIDSSTDWALSLVNVDVVIHTAARAHIMSETSANPLEEFRRVNVGGTLNLANQAAAAGVQKLIFISSIGVNGFESLPNRPFSEIDKPSPHNAYALSKWEAEQGLNHIALETGLEVVIIRPPLVYGRGAPGNFAALMNAVHRGWPLPLGAVRNQRSLVALDNLVDFIVTCIIHPQAANQTFLVSDGQDLSTTELVRAMAQSAKVPVHLLLVPVWALQAGASLLGKGDTVRSLCGNLQVDISKARSLLGWMPPVSLEEGLRRAMVA